MAAVATQHASPELIEEVIESSLLKKVAYRGVLSGWPLDQSILFDVILASKCRRRTKNMATSQEAKNFLPTSHGGLGFRRLSGIIRKRKRTIVDRLHENPLELRVAGTAIINRARRHNQLGRSEKHVYLWASSLLEYASLGVGNLSQPASLKRPPCCSPDNKMDQLAGSDADVLGHLVMMRIQEVGDLTQ